MDKVTISVKQLNSIEKELNLINYKGFKVGSTMSYYFDRLYHGYFDNKFLKHLLSLGNYFIKSFGNKKKIVDYKKSLIYFKTGNYRHHKQMERTITADKELKCKTLIIGNKEASDLGNEEVFLLSNFYDLLKILVFFLNYLQKIAGLLKPLNLKTKTKATLYLNLITQLLKAESFAKFITKQQSVKLIGGDYDRGDESSLFYVVANALKIKNFTLQHGVINPPVGYSPVNADEIWVWGNMARLQLLNLGVEEKKIRITGTPIIEDITFSENRKQSAKVKYNLKTGKTIVLVLSQPNQINDRKMVSLLAEIKKEYGTMNDNFSVKIHPARDFSKYSWIQKDYNIQILPQDVPYEDFLNFVDILLAHSSGLATEALYYGKKIGIIDILDESPGNGLELHKYFKVPLLKRSSDFRKVIKIKDNFNHEKISYKIGDNAVNEISLQIKQIV